MQCARRSWLTAICAASSSSESNDTLGVRRSRKRRTEVATKFLGEIDRDTRVHSALAIEELSLVVQWHESPVPDVGVNVESPAAIAPESDELLRAHVISRRSERHDKALAAQGVEKLTSIRVIVGTPDQRALTRWGGTAACSIFRPVAPAE